MRPVEIEAWALRVIDLLATGHMEDARVELKADWPSDPAKAARRIGGHCNAARGDDVLWLIGVTDAGAVVGCGAADLATWWPKVRANFDEPAPRMTDLAVSTGEKKIVALHFETDRAPYVVRNPMHGKAGSFIEREVPWREGTAIRTARRDDLLRILIPRASLPTAVPNNATLIASERGPSEGGPFTSWYLDVVVYLTGPMGQGYAIAEHLSSLSVSLDGAAASLQPGVDLYAQDSAGAQRRHAISALTVRQGDRQVLVDGPGFLGVRGYHQEEGTGLRSYAAMQEVTVALRLGVAGIDAPIALDLTLRATSQLRVAGSPPSAGYWTLDST